MGVTADTRSQRQTQRQRMDLTRVLAVALTLTLTLWTSRGAAAPTECHFNSRALCVFKGRNFSLGETWMDDGCMQCTCLHPVGVGCCETVHRPIDFPAWCELRVEQVTCKVSLVQTADPRLPCIPGDDLRDPGHGPRPLQPRLEG